MKYLDDWEQEVSSLVRVSEREKSISKETNEGEHGCILEGHTLKVKG